MTRDRRGGFGSRCPAPGATCGRSLPAPSMAAGPGLDLPPPGEGRGEPPPVPWHGGRAGPATPAPPGLPAAPPGPGPGPGPGEEAKAGGRRLHGTPGRPRRTRPFLPPRRLRRGSRRGPYVPGRERGEALRSGTAAAAPAPPRRQGPGAGEAGMQERIQKDIDVVIQKCKAEKDCLFADFRYSDSTFTFTYTGGSKSVSYSVHVSEDYPDNTYVSSSDNDEDVLVTTEPIPVIFHQIATELRKTSDVNYCLSIKSKLQRENGEVSYDGELHKHPQLEADLTAVREIYGPNAVSLREYGAIDDVDIDLHIDVSFLDEEIAVAWDVIRTEPIVVRLHCSLTQYLNGPVPTVDVFQISTKERFGLGHQLKKIMQTFVTQQWKNSKEKSNCTHNKKLSDKKVKSPLHIFSTLRRSPSYPPPGCGKNKSKLKSEQDGISKTHKLLRRTCSSTVKAEDVCATKSHRTFGRSLSSDPRAEQTMAIKSHKLLNRSCSAAVKQEECITLKSHKLLSRSCSGDPRCEHNSTLKPHKLLSRSYSSNLRMEELDGLKNQKLLSKTYSNAPKSSKMEPFKESNIAEGRRLSLTSGLIGILTPSSSSPSQAAQNYGAKCIPVRDRGFLVQTIEFAEQRIPVLNEYCVVCDEPHVFQNGPMLRPTVCERELCVFAFQTLGVMNEAADEIATGAQVVDLLVSMCRSALESPRKVVIFEPYPSVVDPNDPQMLAFNPRKKNYDRVMKALDSITSIREMTQAPYLEIKKQMDKQDPLAHPLLQWVISSNRSHIVKLPVNRQLKFMHTPHQFLLLSSPPAKESNFRAAKNLYGSTFAFHGSHIENWHSILRNGLVVASNTRLQLHGAMFGSGIYLSPLSSISFGYSGMNKKQQKVSAKDEPASSSKGSNTSQSQKKGQQSQFLQSRNLKCIALCEVITSSDLHKHGEIWVVPNTDHVCTRFFFVYEDGQVGDTSINTQEPSIHKEILRVIGNQTATG
ncbi:protein mono-ADP-ribosyltransferase PARP8 isoform X3 [Anas platyrhynchos]|uniref:protein mono-ADP-ribosyltransferase PARP8 isoform X3 n=1 Tax=Anas platyrhynchos TaxID=8839 RepID=UPI0018D8926C|nr:protein mono-ADP-ribosyltransferase PARP8 isoform X3 [Anas platyrhynchos]